ncbi:uncharacterized protein [Nicotiana sylvestris]|uniref:uncharacterized protein n=1 Tax=Nicotiana sylvestris TaxID=4096 RepID=UPI00388CCF7F
MGEGSVNKLSMANGESSMVVKKGSPSDVAAKQEKSKVVVPGVANKPIIIVEGVRTDPVIIKPITRLPVISTKAISWNYEWVIVTYKGKEVKEKVNEAQGLTRLGRCFAPEELRKAKTSRDNPVLVKKVVTKEEAEEFLRKMKVQDYSIMEQWKKTLAQISLLSLLIHSDEHHRALMKILNEAHVPDKISVNHLEKITNKIFEANRVTFSDDELPVEGTEHNKALYLTVKCEDSVVTRVLVGNGSSANICPLSTLNKLKVDDERIHKNIICVRGFDGGGKDSVGDIELELTIDPVEFTMEFQVLDVVVSYNLLLGRLWIHAAKAIPSTLHQMVKFELDRQEIVVHSEDNLCAHSDASIPFIEAEDDKGPWVYQVFEIVSVEKIPKGKCVPTPKITSASVMVAFEMLKNGFVPSKGLGASLQGIVRPVSLPKNLGTFGFVFKPTAADVKRAKRLKQKAWALPKPVPQISKELSHFEEKPKPNLNEKEAINLRDPDNVRETKISIHLVPQIREEIIKALFEYKDIFAWSYDDMPCLSTDLVVHKLPIDPAFSPVKQKLRKFKTDMSVKIKEEVTKQFDAKVSRVAQYPPWLANVVPVPKKDGKTRVCVDYRDLNKILMDEEDAEKTTFITPWRTYCYQVIPFGLKNAGATYMRSMTTIFHDMIHKEIEVYVDDMIMKSRKQSDHVKDLRKFFQRLCRYNLKLNPAKCAFGVPSGKLLVFIVSRRGIELDSSKIKTIQELPPPRNKTEVMSLLGRLNYISRFIAQLTTTCEPIFKFLKKDVAVKWTDECEEAFLIR